VGTWTGCTGPWVPHCQTGNYDRSAKTRDLVPQAVGGIDVNLTRWIQAYGAGRVAIIADRDGIYDAGIIAGVRIAVVPERSMRGSSRDASSDRGGVAPGKVWVTTIDGAEHTGVLLSQSPSAVVVRVDSNDLTIPSASIRLIETPDSILSGILYGFAFGALAGFGFDAHNDSLGLLGFATAGAGFGALLDGLVEGRRLAKLPRRTIDVAPVVSRDRVGAGLRMAWR
jgi:hypothetical protein